MRNVLADLALESEAATALAMRLARAFDAQADEEQSLLRRILTPAAKYWICKRGPAVAAEAMEVLGGNGYVEEGPLARALPADAAQFDLGRRGQRHVPRRAAGARARRALHRRARRRASRRRAPAMRISMRTSTQLQRDLREPVQRRGPGARADAADRACRAGRAAGALRAAVCGGRVLRVAPRARALRRRCVRPSAERHGLRGDRRARLASPTGG